MHCDVLIEAQTFDQSNTHCVPLLVFHGYHRRISVFLLGVQACMGGLWGLHLDVTVLSRSSTKLMEFDSCAYSFYTFPCVTSFSRGFGLAPMSFCLCFSVPFVGHTTTPTHSLARTRSFTGGAAHEVTTSSIRSKVPALDSPHANTTS